MMLQGRGGEHTAVSEHWTHFIWNYSQFSEIYFLICCSREYFWNLISEVDSELEEIELENSK